LKNSRENININILINDEKYNSNSLNNTQTYKENNLSNLKYNYETSNKKMNDKKEKEKENKDKDKWMLRNKLIEEKMKNLDYMYKEIESMGYSTSKLSSNDNNINDYDDNLEYTDNINIINE